MKKVGILYDDISGNTGDQAIGISVRKILTDIGVEFDELVPGRFNPLDYKTVIVGGGHLLRPSPDFYYDKFRLVGPHILNSCGIVGSPDDLEYLSDYTYLSVRSDGDKQKLAYLNLEIRVVPCTAMLLEDSLDLPFKVIKPSVGVQIWEGLLDEDLLVKYLSGQPFHIYFLPITFHNHDYEYLDRLSQKVKNSSLLPILKPQQISALIGKFSYFITGSLHGSIFSYIHNVPFALFESDNKHTFFLKDRKLEGYSFKNIIELKDVIQRIQSSPPDYSNILSVDLNLLKMHTDTIKEILPSNAFVIPGCKNSPDPQKSENVDSLSKLQESNFQLGYLQMQIENMNIEAKHLREEFSEKSNLISEYCKSLQFKDIQIERLNAELERQIAYNARLNEISLSQQVQIGNLEVDLRSKISQIEKLNADLEKQTAYNAQLKEISSSKQLQIGGLEVDLRSKDNEIERLNSSIQTHDSSIVSLHHELQTKEVQIQDLETLLRGMEHGIPIQLRNKYQKIIEKFLRQGTRRRRWYQFALSGIRVIMNEGWKSFFRKALNKVSSTRRPGQ
jgi:hypothetical protein